VTYEEEIERAANQMYVAVAGRYTLDECRQRVRGATRATMGSPHVTEALPETETRDAHSQEPPS
jgi:hypothetical protein